MGVDTLVSAESMHRLVKQVMDSGVASSVEEAYALFQGYRLALEFCPDSAEDPADQAALLTALALGTRVFLGGVSVSGALDVPLTVPLPLGTSLREAVLRLGGRIEELAVAGSAPVIVIGGGPRERRAGFCVRTAARGWRGGIMPAHSELQADGGNVMPLAAMLAAALAVNEAYIYLNGGMPAAGYRTVGMSLWRPAGGVPWLDADETEPALAYLPSRLWLIGLGHLGQAYLWGLSLLPYADRSAASLLLQDTDKITTSTESTSILTDSSMVGRYKTRVMAQWAEKVGFEARVHERSFAGDFKRQADEPAIALCGVDNAMARRALDQVGFDLVVEAGLGRGHRDFRTMRLHVLPGPRAAADIWRQSREQESTEDKPAYAKLLQDGVLDRCGMTLLAGKAVGAPFVGAVASCLALSQVLCLLHGGNVHALIDVDLLALDQRTTLLHHGSFRHLNPGFLFTRSGSI